ncbi:hypothetical protein [Guptibacillus sedimenti]|uniref:hypothetical protein n=1 Tax=Guptibacillus sedimenti TaxID=3025680 RepID=UPI002362C607|nr:hypothetical protein [Pseudalkalibacillus sedimenti]
MKKDFRSCKLLKEVETIEIVKAVKRVQVYGWQQGLFMYDVSQWSRNFTFGMFYAFSMAISDRQNSISFIDQFQHHFLLLWSWVVILLLWVEVFLWVGAFFFQQDDDMVEAINR